ETEYQAALFINCADGRRIAVANTTFRTRPIVKEGFCAIPTNLRILPLSTSSVELRWNPNEGNARCYIIMAGPLDIPSQNWQRYIVPHPNYKLVLQNLTPQRRYGFAIATNCTECEASTGVRTPYSPIVIFMTANNTREVAEVKQKSCEFLNFSLWPNPNKGNFEIAVEGSISGKLVLKVIDLQGKVLWQEQKVVETSYFVQQVELDELLPGMYIFEIHADGHTRRLKFIRE
ncbi:MAG: T9SS type A sorting domain-containing protein, partial [Bacteroidia bacterium]|nr:T9SS type A sorting domain-containing protein [Bacteroidia bacterium]